MVLFITTTAHAGYPAKIRYWYNNNISTNVPALSDIVELRDDSDGQGTKLEWKLLNPPAKAIIDAIDNAVAVAWWKSIELTKDVDYTKWTPRERRLFKWTVKEINKLRVHAGGTAYTKQQVMQALKGE